MRTYLRRLRAWLRRNRLDADLEEEIRQHLALRRDALIDAGLDPAEADAAARHLFGNATTIREQARDMWGFPAADSFLQDARYGARVLRRSPAFTIVAVLSLAVGIGASAAVFSLADAVLLRELPVPKPRELVTLSWVAGKRVPFESLNGTGGMTETETSSTSFSLAAFRALQSRASAYADVFGFADMYRVHLAERGHAEMGDGHFVSGNYFSALGVAPVQGRAIGPDDDRPGAAAVAMISHSLWEQRFGRGDVVGRTLAINGIASTIVGVMPRGFRGVNEVGDAPDVMVPLALRDEITRGEDPAADPTPARNHPGAGAQHVRPGRPADGDIRQAGLSCGRAAAAADCSRGTRTGRHA
jgi:hypothetical protein